ncbi:MAG: phenylalanine--tRNA ligase subunit beta, partial [Gemmatimonadetes bacterium]|nr:phenylalanine--tRNA ligase subunit beta [Gemmatimonadota bacterium]
MNASLRWLRELAPDLQGDARAIAARLAAYGAPVDDIIDVGAALRDIRIGRVIDVRHHPNADRLSLCTVEIGNGNAVGVVCGASNVRAGAYYPFAPVGATLPGGMTLRRAKIRGEESNGMLCSARELELGRDHEGILELHGTFEPGASFIEATGLDDVRLVVDVTPNRPDLLSHWGLARELAPRGDASLGLPAVPGGYTAVAAVTYVQGGEVVEHGGLRITLVDAAGCPRYCAAIVRGVQVKPSPEWLGSRLRAIGQRPINNIVDASNWVLHELGQPTHAFDLGALGSEIVVRRARAGETLVTLDGSRRTLDSEVLVIADARRAVALAGIIGGQDTEVVESTTDVLIECALFDTRTVRQGRRQVDLSTDASQRFERGVDPDGMRRAIERVIALILATAGGNSAIEVVLADAGVAAPPPVPLRPERIAHLLGVPIEPREIVELLAPLGFQPADGHASLAAAAANEGRISGRSSLTFAIPGHRRYDVSREVDLIEEIARRRGYDSFPSDVRPFRPSTVPDDPMARLEDRLRVLLTGRGFLEARSAPLAPATDGDVTLQLPLSAAETTLRRALVPGLVRRAESNFNRGIRDVRLFEIGTAFAPGEQDGLPRETTRVAAIMTGARSPAHWSGAPQDIDVWDLRGLMADLSAVVSAVVEPDDGGSPAPIDHEQT